jgi:hypothetical protein
MVFQGEVGEERVWMRTVRSWNQRRSNERKIRSGGGETEE